MFVQERIVQNEQCCYRIFSPCDGIWIPKCFVKQIITGKKVEYPAQYRVFSTGEVSETSEYSESSTNFIDRSTKEQPCREAYCPDNATRIACKSVYFKIGTAHTVSVLEGCDPAVCRRSHPWQHLPDPWRAVFRTHTGVPYHLPELLLLSLSSRIVFNQTIQLAAPSRFHLQEEPCHKQVVVPRSGPSFGMGRIFLTQCMSILHPTTLSYTKSTG